MPYTKEFKQILRNTKKTYLGKEPSQRYKKRYGLEYDSAETKSIAYAIANSKGIKIDRRSR